jgi:hypothetical protein
VPFPSPSIFKSPWRRKETPEMQCSQVQSSRREKLKKKKKKKKPEAKENKRLVTAV